MRPIYLYRVRRFINTVIYIKPTSTNSTIVYTCTCMGLQFGPKGKRSIITLFVSYYFFACRFHGHSHQNLFLKKNYILRVVIAYKLLFFFRLEYKLGFFVFFLQIYLLQSVSFTENVSFLWDHLYPGYVDIAYKVKFFFRLEYKCFFY